SGMFAFALWDARERCLALARDRLGKKPLYWARSRATLWFGSELKALRAHRAFRAELDRDALALFFRHGYVPAPHAIYPGARQLVPGTGMEVHADGRTDTHTFWDARRVAAAGRAAPAAVDVRDAEELLLGRLRESVRSRMVADVPVGAFLSGGIDSSLVV